MNSDTCMLNYIKTNAFRGFLFGRKALCPPPPGGRGYSSQFGIGVCRQGSQALTLFKGRKSRIDTLLNAQNQEMAPYLRETR